MSHPPRDLQTLQSWMQAVIMHPSGVESGLQSPAARAEIDLASGGLESVILRSQSLASADRLRVYASAYYARLLECMRSLFPTAVHAVGEETFDGFAFEYLQHYPSQSYTLGKLADRFVDFLRQTRPKMDTRAESPTDNLAENSNSTLAPDWPELLIDLALLDWTIDEVFDGPGNEDGPKLTPESLNGVAVESLPTARLVPVPCLRLLRFEYPVNEYYSAVRRGDDPTIPRPRRSFLALSRRDYVVRRFPLSSRQHALLDSLLAGQPVGEAIAIAAEADDDEPLTPEHLQDWFRLWSREGLFKAVELET